jgi:hypothetical protein
MIACSPSRMCVGRVFFFSSRYSTKIEAIELNKPILIFFDKKLINKRHQNKIDRTSSNQ